MLVNLQIHNYILIEKLNVNWESKYNVLTGETGAGKSILLGALALLSGKKADFKTILDIKKKCTIEGTFKSPENSKPLFEKYDLEYYNDVIIRREIHPNGRSRAFINDTPVTNEVLKQLSHYLVDIHSQHESNNLAYQHYQLELLDSFAGTQNQVKLINKKFSNNQLLQHQIQKLETERDKKQKDKDYNQFLLDELKALAIKKNEQKKLEEEQKILKNANNIKENISIIINTLGENEASTINQLREILQNFRTLSQLSKTFEEYYARIDSTIIELDDITRSLESELDDIEDNPVKLETIEERINQIYKLQKKHNVSTESELIAIQEKLSAIIVSNEEINVEIKRLQKEYDEELMKLNEIAKNLSNKRNKAIPQLESEITVICRSLGMPYAQIKIDNNKTLLSKNGTDDIKLLFSANKGVKPQEISKKASGGETSRLAFAIKVILARKNELPTLVFDEIDTGVSGEVAHQMGEYMSSIGTTSQIIAISHLPQIASKARNHYFVYKNYDKKGTTSHVKLLDNKDRVNELAKMIGGDNPSDIAIENAKEMLGSSKPN